MIIKVQNKDFLTAKIIFGPWQSQCVTRRHCRAKTSGIEYHCLQVTPHKKLSFKRELVDALLQETLV